MRKPFFLARTSRKAANLSMTVSIGDDGQGLASVGLCGNDRSDAKKVHLESTKSLNLFCKEGSCTVDNM